jgi:hypothetical protein
MQEAARVISNLQAESDGVDLATLLREVPREAYAFQQLGVRPLTLLSVGRGVRAARTPPRAPQRAARSRYASRACPVTTTSDRPDPSR